MTHQGIGQGLGQGIDPAWSAGLRTMRSGKVAYLHVVDDQGRGAAEVNIDHVLAGVQLVGVDWDDVDRHLGFPYGTVHGWSVSWESPTYADLLQLADAAQLPVDFFYWPPTPADNTDGNTDADTGQPGQLESGDEQVGDGGGAVIIAFPTRPDLDTDPDTDPESDAESDVGPAQLTLF